MQLKLRLWLEKRLLARKDVAANDLGGGEDRAGPAANVGDAPSKLRRTDSGEASGGTSKLATQRLVPLQTSSGGAGQRESAAQITYVAGGGKYVVIGPDTGAGLGWTGAYRIAERFLRRSGGIFDPVSSNNLEVVEAEIERQLGVLRHNPAQFLHTGVPLDYVAIALRKQAEKFASLSAVQQQRQALAAQQQQQLAQQQLAQQQPVLLQQLQPLQSGSAATLPSSPPTPPL